MLIASTQSFTNHWKCWGKSKHNLLLNLSLFPNIFKSCYKIKEELLFLPAIIEN